MFPEPPPPTPLLHFSGPEFLLQLFSPPLTPFVPDPKGHSHFIKKKEEEERSGGGVGEVWWWGDRRPRENLHNQQQDVCGHLEPVGARLRPLRQSCVSGINQTWVLGTSETVQNVTKHWEERQPMRKHPRQRACLRSHQICTGRHTDLRLFVYQCCHLCLFILRRAHSGTGYGD